MDGAVEHRHQPRGSRGLSAGVAQVASPSNVQSVLWRTHVGCVCFILIRWFGCAGCPLVGFLRVLSPPFVRKEGRVYTFRGPGVVFCFSNSFPTSTFPYVVRSSFSLPIKGTKLPAGRGCASVASSLAHGGPLPQSRGIRVHGFGAASSPYRPRRRW